METQDSRKISEESRAFLKDGIGQNVDFKQAPDAVSMVDLVAFANADSGGWILVGVTEKGGDDGPCPGKVTGCEINRDTILTVLSKAQSCVPPVAIEMYPERHKKRSFLKVRIPSSPSRPHCTSSGLYCVREGDKIRPLVPGELLQQFLATGAHLLDLHRDQTVQAFEGRLKMLSSAVRQEIAEAGRGLLLAGSQNGATWEEPSQVRDMVQQLGQMLADVDERVRELFRQDEREDPVDARYVKKFRTEIRTQLEGEAPEALQKISEGAGVELSLSGKTNKELTGDRVKSIFYDLVQEVLSERERGGVSG